MPVNPPSAALQREAMSRMTGQKVRLTPEQRTVVERAIEDVAKFRAWQLIELSCRSNHVHAIVSTSGATPDKAMSDFKAYATRALRENGWFADQPVWTRGGSKRHINSQESLRSAIQYVKFQDGDPNAAQGHREI
jgi:REP element-mobilizing transposase RayT